jgi:ribosomal protein L9
VLTDTSNLEFSKKASPTGNLFASVTRHEIAHELTKKTGMKIETDALDLGEHGEHIKHVGEHVALVDLGSGLKAEVKVVVKSGN